ncbi:MAG: PRC-barrel domain-containing protein, partial [Actinomycetota bacterium]|nr:PRC-barrel domain-containing protein [Actinomycetota bacterium]
MAGEDHLRELEERYEDYKVYDNAGEKIGKVDDLFIDEADREEYIGVKMGFFGLSSTLIPMEIVRVDERERTMEVSVPKDHVKEAPTFDDDDDITPDFEDRIRRHFGLESMESSMGRGSYGRYGGAPASGAT